MLFIALQTHGPKECPLNDKNPQPLWDTKAKHIKVKHILGCTPAHTLYFVVEANDFNALQEFFAPGMTRCLVDIKPVVEMK